MSIQSKGKSIDEKTILFFRPWERVYFLTFQLIVIMSRNLKFGLGWWITFGSRFVRSRIAEFVIYSWVATCHVEITDRISLYYQKQTTRLKKFNWDCSPVKLSTSKFYLKNNNAVCRNVHSRLLKIPIDFSKFH